MIYLPNETLAEWFSTFRGFCMKEFGYKDGKINFPDYGCQAEKVYKDMLEKLNKDRLEPLKP